MNPVYSFFKLMSKNGDVIAEFKNKTVAFARLMRTLGGIKSWTIDFNQDSIIGFVD